MTWMDTKIIDEKNSVVVLRQKSDGALKEKEERKWLLFFWESLGLLWRLAYV